MRNVEELMQDRNNLMPYLSVCIIWWVFRTSTMNNHELDMIFIEMGLCVYRNKCEWVTQ